MGAKWSTVSTVTYADGSPSDDGSATAANRVKFATIKTDLTDPLKTATDSIIAKLDERFNETTTAVATNYTTTASDHAKILEVTSGTVTLLASSSAGAGYRVGVYGSGANITVARSASDTINGATSATVKSGTVAWFIVNAAGNGYVGDNTWDGLTIPRFKTGTYTGNGPGTKAITGIGFAPKYLKIWRRRTVSGGVSSVFETADVIMDDNAAGGSIYYDVVPATFLDQVIASLDSDGFTVWAGSSSADPNASGVDYNYLCLG